MFTNCGVCHRIRSACLAALPNHQAFLAFHSEAKAGISHPRASGQAAGLLISLRATAEKDGVTHLSTVYACPLTVVSVTVFALTEVSVTVFVLHAWLRCQIIKRSSPSTPRRKLAFPIPQPRLAARR